MIRPALRGLILPAAVQTHDIAMEFGAFRVGRRARAGDGAGARGSDGRRRERAEQEAKQATLEADLLTTARTVQGISGA